MSHGSITNSDISSVSTFVYRGHRVGLLEPVNCGELIRLLPGWTSPRIPVSTVYAGRKFLPS